MKNLSLFFVFAVLALLSSCKTDDTENIATSNKIILNAQAHQATESRVGLEDLSHDNNFDTEGIVVTWQRDVDGYSDSFTLYNASGNYVDTFDYQGNNGATSGDFIQRGNAIIADGTYTAVFPASSAQTLTERDAELMENTTQKQDLSLSHLNTAVRMRATLNFSGDAQTSLFFEHELAMMTFTFIMDEGKTPESLVFADGEKSYTLNFVDNISTEDPQRKYTAYFMISPTAEQEREISFTLSDNEGTQKSFSVTTSKAYEAGVRYSGYLMDEKTIIIETEDYMRNIITRSSFSNDGLSLKWTEGDELLLRKTDGSAELTFSLKDANSGIFSSLSETKPDGGSYELFYPATLASSAQLMMENQVQQGNDSEAHLGAYSYLSASEVTSLDKPITMQHHTAQIKFQLSVPESVNAADIKTIRLSSSGNNFVKSQNLDGTSKVKSSYLDLAISLTNEELTEQNNRLLTAYAMILPTSLNDATITVSLLDENNSTLHSESESGITRDFVAGCQYNAMMTDMLNLDVGRIVSQSSVWWQQFGPGMSGNNKSGFWHPTDPDYLYISPNMGNSYVSTDKGYTYNTILDWDGASIKDTERGVNELMSIDFSRQNDKVGYATDSTTRGLFETDDKGMTWNEVDMSKFAGFDKCHLACVTVDPTNDKIWYLGAGRFRDDAQLLFSDSYPHGNPESISVNSQQKIWKTTNGGATWELKNTGLHANAEVESIIVDPVTPNIIYVSTNYGFYRSSNSGESWTNIALGSEAADKVIRSLAMHHDKQTNQITLFAIANVMWAKDTANQTVKNASGGVYKSTDKGATWTNINSNLSIDLSVLDEYGNKSIRNSYSNPLSYQFEYWTNGNHDLLDKTQFYLDFPNYPTEIMQRVSLVIVDPNNVDRIFLVNDYSNASRNNFLPGEMWRSENGGASWEVCVRMGARWDSTKTNSDDYLYWQSRGNTLGNNVDLRYLEHWEQRAEYESKSITFAAYNADGSVLHAQLAKISLMSYDGGDTWVDIDDEQTQSEDSFVGAGNSNVPGHGFFQHPALPNQVFCSSGENSLWITNSEKITDPARIDAQAAKNIKFTDNEMSLSCYAVHPHDTNIHYALFFRQHNMGEMMRSTDGGLTWEVWSDESAHPIPRWQQVAYSGDQSVHQLCLTIDPQNPDNMYFCVPWKAGVLQFVGDSATGIGFHRSHDGGKTWTDETQGLPVTSFKKEQDTSPEEKPSIPRIAIDPKTNWIYAAVELINGGLYVSKDHGATWSEVESTAYLVDDTNGSFHQGVNDIHFAQDGAVYITVGSQNTPVGDKMAGLWVSYDNMQTWTKIFNALFPVRIESARYDSKLLLLNALPNVPNGNINSGTYLSRDGGATWQKINANNGQSDRVNDIAIDYTTPGKYYASTYGSGWYAAIDEWYK